MSYPNAAISFPGLFGSWKFTMSPKLLDVGNGVYWYGVLIALALLVGLFVAMKQAPKYGLTEDHVFDTVIGGLPFGIIGARLYYVLFNAELFRSAEGKLDFGKVLRIWDGGIAIYGGILGALLAMYFICRAKKVPFLAVVDCSVIGLFLGQAIGRWGNFFNREAFGAMTDLPWRMRLWLSDSYFIDVHPTFLYECLWNLLGFCLLLFVVSKHRRFDGQNTCFYFLWYGVGRFFIEGLRTDSLYLFDWQIHGAPVRVSQALSLLLMVATALILLGKRKADPSLLYVNQKAAEKAAAEAAEAAEEAAAEIAELVEAINAPVEDAVVEDAPVEESAEVPEESADAPEEETPPTDD